MHYGIDIKWLAVTAFELRCGDTTIVTDPFITECAQTDLDWNAVENCHIICLSHAHWDHITDIPRLMDKFSPLLLCGDQTATPMAQWLNCSPSHIYPMYPDMELDFGDVKIKALYGRHTNLAGGHNDWVARTQANPIAKADPHIAAMQGVGGMEYRNYLFTLPNGTKILLWGNNPTPVQVNLCKALKPDIAIIQRSVKPEEIAGKAAFAAAIGCKVLIPHHHDFKTPEDPKTIETFREEFLKRVPDGIFLNPVHGQWMHL